MREPFGGGVRDCADVAAKRFEPKCVDERAVLGFGQARRLWQMVDAQRIAVLVEERRMISDRRVECEIFVVGHVHQ